MLKKAFHSRIGISPKPAVVSIILIANAFIWYFYVSSYIGDVIKSASFSNSEILTIWGINFFGMAGSAILGASLIYRLRRRMTFLRYWMLAGVILSLVPMVMNVTTSTGLIVVAAVLGLYFGLGMPTCMAYYAAVTEAGNRSRLGGIIFLLIGLGFFLLYNIGTTDAAISVLILATWRAFGLASLLFLKAEEKYIEMKSDVSYRLIASNRSFLLYFIPWSMFSLVNCMGAPVNNKFLPENLIISSAIIINIVAGISAVVGGFFADSVGRKRLTVAGFVLLGLGYAIIGLFPGNLLGWWLFTTVDGIAWGIFCTIFLITIWGDLAQGRGIEKYYAIGSLPFLLSNFLRLTIGAYVAAIVINEFAVFSFASFFLFLAVLPLVYAPETLPEKHIKERELKSYLERAKREREKYA